MGSSVITKVRVYAVRSPKMPGGLGYWVEETGYEKNVPPHTESSSVMAIGDRARILKRLFSLAAQFPGGSLQLRSGKGSAKHMLDKWLAELDNPWVYPEGASISLDCSGGWYSAVTDTTKPRVIEIMAAHGHSDVVELIEQGQKRIEVDLSNAFPALAELPVKREGDVDNINLPQESPYVDAWKIIRGYGVKSSNDAYKEEHKPSGRPTEPGLPFQFYALTLKEGIAPDLFTVLQPDHSLTRPDSLWSIEAQAISKSWEMERDAPGQYREFFKVLKLSTEQTKPLPPEATITCSMELVLAKPWLKSAHRNVTQELQIPEGSFTITYGQALRQLSVNGMYNLLRSLGETLKIELPPPKVEKADERQQELLFA